MYPCSPYINHNRGNRFYNELLPPDTIGVNDMYYRNSLDYLKENKLILMRGKPIIPWKVWIPLKKYKGDYYVYRPCDGIFHFAQSINDTTFIDWTVEGPTGHQIQSFFKTENNIYVFELNNMQRFLFIHIIDHERGIAIFEDTNDRRGNKYHLMIAAEKMRSVPIIVNYCPLQKQRELQFEAPDFESLLKSTPKK